MRLAQSAILLVLLVSFMGRADASDSLRSQGAISLQQVPAEVEVGMYMLRIPSLDLRTNQCSIDAYIWFRAKEGMSPKPWQTFEVTNGTIDHREVCDQKTFTVKKDGKEEKYCYACLRIEATLTQLWDVGRYPLDRHNLVIAIEDSKRDESLLRYRPEAKPWVIDEAFQTAGWTFGHPVVTVIPHSYRTTYGDPDLPSDGKSTFSRLAVEIPMSRANSVVYSLKVVTALYVAVCIAFLTFFVTPHHAEVRFVIGTSAIFASVASQYVIAASLPDSSQLTLVEKLHVLGHLTILLSMIISVAAVWLHGRERHQTAWHLDRIIGFLVILAYVALNVWLIAQPG